MSNKVDGPYGIENVRYYGEKPSNALTLWIECIRSKYKENTSIFYVVDKDEKVYMDAYIPATANEKAIEWLALLASTYFDRDVKLKQGERE